MTREEAVLYWIETSDNDYNTMLHLFETEDYHWSLFIGHLVVEKLLKAVFAKNCDDYQTLPRSHDLLYLAERARVTLSERLKEQLAVITAFNIQARYPDYKGAFYKKCTHEYCAGRHEDIREVRQWLKKILEV